MDTIQFTAPVDENNNDDWKKKKNYGPAVLVTTILLLGLAFLAGHSYASVSSGRTGPNTGSGSVMGGLSTVGEKAYPYVEVKNATPYRAYGVVTESDGFQSKMIDSGATWTSMTSLLCYTGIVKRDRCKVWSVYAYVKVPEELDQPVAERVNQLGLPCTSYRHFYRPVTTDSRTFSIIMNGVDKNGVARCSVRDDTPTRPSRPTVPNVQVTNDTPYAVAPGKRNAQVWYNTPQLDLDYPSEGIAPGDTWTATSRSSTTRGFSKVGKIFASLTLPNGRRLTCTTNYDSPGTTDSLFSIIMDGVDRCCVRSSQDDTIPNPYTPTKQKCAGNYGSNVPCCSQEGTGTVGPQYQCPQSKPNCVNYVHNEHWGTCVAACD